MRRIIALLTAALLLLSPACLAEMPTTPPDLEKSSPDATAAPLSEPAADAAEPGYTPMPAFSGKPMILMPDPPQGTAMEVGGLFASGSTVLGSDVPRASIREIRFRNTIFAAPDEAWDVSAERNFSVLAWVEDGVLTVAGEGGVWANEDSTGLFADYASLERIEFNDCFHMERAANLSRLFEGDWSLKALDTSSWDTSAATDMSYMFSSCPALTELDLSGLDTSRVTSMEGMFLLDASLESLDISGFDAGSAENLMSMFEGCAALRSLELGGFALTGAANLKRAFAGCTSLAVLDIGASFPSGAQAQDMFADCPAMIRANGVEMRAGDWARVGEYVGLRSGSTGDGVRWLQRKLLAAGCEVGSVDGSFGPATEAALIAWQIERGFEATGETDQAQVLELMKIPDAEE